MIRRAKIGFISLMFLMVASSCLKKDDISVIPKIEYKDFVKIPTSNGIDNKGVVSISFTDGDGDIGLTNTMTNPPYDTSSTYYYNCFITYLEKQNGEMKEVDLPFTFNARIPYVTPRGQNKGLKGVVEIEIFINNPISVHDTIQFKIAICDRALNVSNSVYTPEIIVKKH